MMEDEVGIASARPQPKTAGKIASPATPFFFDMPASPLKLQSAI
jgi:hypothetical protein